VFAEQPAEFDPRKYLGPARAAVQAVVEDRIRLLWPAPDKR
jgi:fructose/tagatose bisphosphate aldolase